MNELISLIKILINYQNRMKSIHWNISGPHFDRIHKESEGLYEIFDGMIDRCGEIIKVLGGTPPILMDCTLPSDSDFKNTSFDSKTAWNHMNTMVSNLINQYNKAIEVPNLLEGIKSKLSDDQYTLIVELYKMRQRCK